MKAGNIVEYIDRQRLICAVVLDPTPAGGKRLYLFTENAQEVNLPRKRITHAGGRLDPDLNRAELGRALQQTVDRRNALMETVDVRSLWKRLHENGQWVSLDFLKNLCFGHETSAEHESALIRAMFADGLYFKFDHTRFLPRTPEQIKTITARKKKEERKQRIVEEGSQWLREAMTGNTPELTPREMDFVEILKAYYIFEQEAEDKALAREMLNRAGDLSREAIFPLMVRLGVWAPHENIDFYRYGVSTAWPAEVTARAEAIGLASAGFVDGDDRVDLTDLPVFTIDGSTTADYDDALSVETETGGGFRLGVHISDVAHHIQRNDPVDKEALVRASSIYTADQKVPMLPPLLSEDICSLKAGVDRPAVSVLMRFSPLAELTGYEIIPAIVRVDHHLSYGEADRTLEQDERLKKLNKLTGLLRQQRMQNGAMQITIPDLFIQFIDKDRVAVNRMENISPSRMMVAEMMITANRLFADFLSARQVPVVFRAQAKPKNRLVKKADGPGTLFQNWVQRKMIARVVLDSRPGHHAGLGLERYTTATSPIRKYLDLVAQRQVRSVLGLETAYSREEIDDLIQVLEPQLGKVAKIQQARQRYWLLKYLETRIGAKEEAVVLDKYAHDYSVLLPDYLLECRMPRSSGTNFKPNDLIQVTIQHVNARSNIISIFFG